MMYRKYSLIALLGFVTFGCVSANKYNRIQEQYENDVGGLKQVNDELARRNALLESQKEAYAAHNDALNSELALLNDRYRALKELSSQTKGNLEKFKHENQGEVDIGEKGQLIISGKLLFQSGSAELSQRGEKALDQLNETVLKNGTYYLRIAGHTDSDPIKHTKGRWVTGLNHELGAYRALNVLAYLVKKGYANPKYTVIESYGQYQPISSNDTRKEKAKNRRVEIFLQELVEKSSEKSTQPPPSGK